MMSDIKPCSNCGSQNKTGATIPFTKMGMDRYFDEIREEIRKNGKNFDTDAEHVINFIEAVMRNASSD